MQSLYILALVLSIFTGSLLLSKVRNQRENLLLGLFFLMFSIDMLVKIGPFNFENIFLKLTIQSLNIIQFIFLYLYIDFYLFRRKNTTRDLRKHLFFLLSALAPLPFIFLFVHPDNQQKYILYFLVPIIVFNVFYYFLIIFLKIRDYYVLENKNNLKFFWTAFIYMSLYIPFISSISFFIISHFNSFFSKDWFEILSTSLIIITSLCFHTLKFRNPAVFHAGKKYVIENIEENVISKKIVKTDKNKYVTSTLNEENALLIKEKLMEYIELKKPYLDPEINLQKVASDLEISKHHLTEVLNIFLEKNFYTFINEYRIEEVKSRLLDPKYNNRTIISIGMDCGFNSKSVFNQSFKNHTKLTPSEFRKQNLEITN
ncbi:helix-turn-helix domain-containing protein [Aureivirga sp. CE67]|uniref:helix-turn-helix domain-containing protein n=1 Tax=Aureivirga sp. CE67 TaxID=1788983 RepID=UPI0018CBA7E7|nr:helix-turn-helix domain-containing protein [Aureivirga sp. CE67]